VSATQIYAIMPSNAPLGMASLQLVYNNSPSNYTPVQITKTSFGIYTLEGTGLGPGALQNYISATNQPINAATISAQPGQTVTLWGTGLGPVSYSDSQAPVTGNLPVQVQVFVGGVSAQVQYSGRNSCCSGLDQITFTVPNNAPLGCWVPVYVKTAGSVVSNYISMAISSGGGACPTLLSPDIGSLFVDGGSLGEAIVARAITNENVGVTAPVTVTSDYHLSFAFNIPGARFPFNPAVTLPPAGTCAVYVEAGDMLNSNPLPGSLPNLPISPLDLGPAFVLTGPNGTQTLTPTFTQPFSVRAGLLGGSISNNILPSSLVLNPGSYSVTGSGGTGVGNFSANFTIPPPFTWVNQSQLGVVNRTQPLTITLSGVAAGSAMYVVGVGEDLPTNSSATFTCSIPAGASSFTIPADALANLPATRINPLQSQDVIYVVAAQGGSVQNLNATGLTQGTTSAFLIDGQTVVLQ